MHLLNTRTKRLSEFFNELRPPYAILSHTWGSEEVTFQVLLQHHEEALRPQSSSKISSRAGWKKIEAFCEQALRDDFEWVWIDTCCINKSSSAELSEAINSMFAWYSDSKVCYAFLEDVVEVGEDIFAHNSSFRSSRWFTRGWTLQELLAPRRIKFFNSDWQFIGRLTKRSDQVEVVSERLITGSALVEVLSEITSIQSSFLNDFDLRSANVAIKMSWASQRVTTRIEDMAYCLLGIFDVNMPLLYGEGTKAFVRLQEEILKKEYDHTLLAWGLLPGDPGYTSYDTEDCGFLATSVADFARCGSHNLCQSSAKYKPSIDHTLKNESLRVQVPLKRLSTRNERHECRYVAILDCFSRREPSKRVGVQLRLIIAGKSGFARAIDSDRAKEGDIFVRTGKALVFSDVDSYHRSTSSGYITRTIHIAVGVDLQRHQQFKQSALIDLPTHYRYSVEYIHPRYTVDKDPYTVEPNSLRVTKRGSRETLELDSEAAEAQASPRAIFRVWWHDLLTNISFGSLMSPFSKPTILLCIKLTRKSYLKLTMKSNALHICETPSFVAILKEHSGSLTIFGRRHLRVAPVPQHFPHMQPGSPSNMIQSLIGRNSLTVANETFVVRKFFVPDSLRDSRKSSAIQDSREIQRSSGAEGFDMARNIDLCAYDTMVPT